MNEMEIRSFVADFYKDSGEIDEPGADSTRRPRMPAGIAIPRKRDWSRHVAPKFNEFDKEFAKRAFNALLQNDLDELLCSEEIENVGSVEDALIAAIDERSNPSDEENVVALPPQPRVRAKSARAAA